MNCTKKICSFVILMGSLSAQTAVSDTETPVRLQWSCPVWYNGSYEDSSMWTPQSDPKASTSYLCFARSDDCAALVNNWITCPGEGATFYGFANSSVWQVFMLTCGADKYYRMTDAANSPGLWFVDRTYSGFATRGDAPLVLDRVLVQKQLVVNPESASHVVEIRRPMGSVGIEKKGLGTLRLDLPYRGGVIHRGGVLELGHPSAANTGYAGVPVCRFDAAETNSMTFVEDGSGELKIEKWSDADGGALYASGPCGFHSCPRIGTEMAAGIRLVSFGAYSGGVSGESESYPNGDAEVSGPAAMLRYSSDFAVREVFFVARQVSEGAMHTPFEWSYAQGRDDRGSCHFVGNGCGLISSTDRFTAEADGRINGFPVFSKGSNYNDYRGVGVLQVYHVSATNEFAVRNFGGFGDNGSAGGFVLAEAIAYTNALTEVERAQTTAYLMKKWHVNGVDDLVYRDLGYMELQSEGAVVEVPAGREARIDTVHPPKAAPNRGFVKTGAGTLILDRTETASLEVRDGYVRFVREAVDGHENPQPAFRPHFWGDATQTDRFLFEKDPESGTDTVSIAAWQDCRVGVAVTMTNNYIKATQKPFYNPCGIRSLPCVDFGAQAEDGARLGLSSGLDSSGAVTYSARLVEGFLVWRNTSGKDRDPLIFSDYAAASFSRSPSDLSSWNASDGLQCSAHWSVNGCYSAASGEAYGIGWDDWAVIRVSCASPCYGNALSGARDGWGGGVQVGEFICYDRALTDAERHETEAYLMAKWKGTSTSETRMDSFGNLSFVGAADPILDVEGCRSFASLSAAGVLVKRGAGTAVMPGLPQSVSGLNMQLGTLRLSTDATLPSALTFTCDAGGVKGAVSIEGAVSLSDGGTVTLSCFGKLPVGSYRLVTADSVSGGSGWTLACDSSVPQRSLRLVRDERGLRLDVTAKGLLVTVR